MPEFKKDPNELGCLWEKTSSRGTYFTGTINGQPIVVFKNGHKTAGSKAPDWHIYKPQAKAPVPEAARVPGEDDISF